MSGDDFKGYILACIFTSHHNCAIYIAKRTNASSFSSNSSDESKFLNDSTSQEMIEFLTRVSLVGLSKNAQLQLSAFIEGFAKVCTFGICLSNISYLCLHPQC